MKGDKIGFIKVSGGRYGGGIIFIKSFINILKMNGYNVHFLDYEFTDYGLIHGLIKRIGFSDMLWSSRYI